MEMHQKKSTFVHNSKQQQQQNILTFKELKRKKNVHQLQDNLKKVSPWEK